jgi:hypothetical protein
MTCPDEIAEVLLEIIEIGILRIRGLGWGENAVRCAVEADHLHNLPHLISHFSEDLLKYYWDVERPSFIGQGSPESIAQFTPLWERLATHLRPTMATQR